MTTVGTSECVYRYEEQPLTNLECNSYLNNVLRLVCRIEGPTQLAFIRWYWVPLNTEQLQRLNQSPGKYSIISIAQQVSATGSQVLRSQLRVFPLNDSDARRYFCQAGLGNGTLLTPSNELILNVQSTYTVSAACSFGPFITTTTSCASIVTDDSAAMQPTTGNTQHTDVTTVPLNTQPSPTKHVHQPSTRFVTTPLPNIPTYSNMELPANDSLWIYIVVPLTGVLCVIIVSLLIIFMAVMIHMRKKTLSQGTIAN